MGFNDNTTSLMRTHRASGNKIIRYSAQRADYDCGRFFTFEKFLGAFIGSFFDRGLE